MDPVFNLNAARAKEICRFIAQHNHRRVPLHTEVWAEFIDDEMARLFAAANFTFLEVGLQTTDTSKPRSQTVERRLKQQRLRRAGSATSRRTTSTSSCSSFTAFLAKPSVVPKSLDLRCRWVRPNSRCSC